MDNITGPNVTGSGVAAFINRDNYAMRSFSIGGQFFADINAPLEHLMTMTSTVMGVAGLRSR